MSTLHHRLRGAGLVVAFAVVGGAAAADVVTDWNEVMLDAVRATSTNPPRATRAFAMVHGAMFDAINGVERDYQPYLVRIPAPRHTDPEIAGAVAAHTVLSALFPTRQADFDSALAETVDTHGRGRGRGDTAKSIRWGRFVGQRMLRARANDGADVVVPYTPSTEFGAWQPTPPAMAPALLPNWAYVKPFAMGEPSSLRLGPPPAFDSTEWAAAFNEVKDLGRVDSTLRTPDETIVAYFWEDGPTAATPPGHWLTIAQQLSAEFDLSLVENARLFALLAITQADAAICSWDHKYHYNHLRPVTGIRTAADGDDNSDTVADPAWSSLIPTPPFPAYTSGHSTFSGGSARILALFLGTDAIAFSAPSPDPHRWPNVLPGVVRSWSSLSQAAEEAGQSRIYGGIHWQHDNQVGLESGRALADLVFENLLRPVD
jgi:hypothetical protein